MKIKIFGAGNAFKDFMACKKAHVQVIACYSSNPADANAFDVPIVHDLAHFVDLPSDLVVLALRDVAQARRRLIDAGQDAETILSFYNSGDVDLLRQVRHDALRLNALLDLQIRPPAISSMWMHSAKNVEFDSFDWVRNTAFELMSHQISARDLGGACAELGVYRGDQAAVIGKLFPEKKLYLFDTFEGFSTADLALESAGFSVSTSQDFANTSLSEVLGKIENPQRVVIRKGYFPESAIGVEDTFCFVSLDVDLYAPTLSGLEYFYPRLVSGGVIFVHDYNNARYKGVRSAVDGFRDKTGCPTFQLPDAAGSIAILK